MSLGKKLFIGGGGGGTCSTDSVQPFGVDSAYSSNIALYQLDSDGGTTNNVPDTVGNYNGTASNVTYSTGKYGNAAVFNGSSSNITTSGLKGYSKQTWSFWINPDVVNSRGHLMGTYPSGTIGQGAMYVELQSNGNVEAGVRNSSGSTSSVITTTPLTASQWHHIVVTSSGSELKLYINGASPITTSATVTTLDSTNVGSLAIGYEQRNNTHYFDGLIDQVRIYDKALSSFEVDVLYNETTDTVSDINVLGEGSGIALYTLDYDASDESGNYDGTPTDVEFGVDGQINWGASFNGSSSEIEFTTDSNFVNDFSISAWINMNQLPASAYLYQVVAWGDEATGERRSLGIWNGGSGDPKVYFSGFGSAANFGGSTSVSANQWYHVCVTRSGSTVKVYLDGNLDGTGTVTLNSYTGTTGRIGNSASANEHFNGTIDQVRIFQKALSSDEVSTLYGETACVYTSTTDQVNYQGTNAAYYKLDNTAEDETGNYDGTESNITYEFGRYGQAAVFNGSNSGITTGLGNSQLSVSSAWSCSCWIYSSSFSNATNILGMEDSASPYSGWSLYQSTSAGLQPMVNGNAVGTAKTLTANQWYNVVLTYSGTVLKFYVDGTQIGSDVTISISTPSSNFDIGNLGIYNVYSGKVDQVRIYNSELDATAVENLYNEKPATNTSNFNVALYTGIGNTQYISNVGFQPDLVWIKNRDNSFNHNLYFDLGGAINRLRSNTDGLADTSGNLSSFEANGFILTGSNSNTNNNGDDYVAWCWKGGGDAISNTVGDITSQVSANQDAGFSIVEYTGNLSAATTATGESVGHGLSSPPELIIFKNTSNITQWNIFSSELDNWSTRLQFDTSQKNDLYSQYPIADPTSSVFYTNYLSSQNVSGSTHIAYCFHSVTGYQKIGSYTGTGGTYVNTISFGFAPAFVLIKRANSSGGWRMFDSTRDTGTRPFRINHSIRANLNSQEYDGTNDPNGYMSFTNDGISFSTTEVNGDLNANGGTYIYLAIA